MKKRSKSKGLRYIFTQGLTAISGRAGLQTKVVLIASKERNKRENDLIQ